MRYIPYNTPMYNGTSYQSNPTIGIIGGYGYPPNGYYNQCFNPYYLRQQQEYERRRQVELAKNQADIWVQLVKCRNAVMGDYQTDEEIMDRIKYVASVQQQANSDEEFMQKLHEINMRSFQSMYSEASIQENINHQQQVMSQEHVEEKSFYQWLHEDAQDRYMESQYAELNRQQRNTANLYDSNAYNRLLGTHNSVFNSLNKNVTIDDMEIQVSLPQHLKNERDIRRQRFAASIIRGMQ